MITKLILVASLLISLTTFAAERRELRIGVASHAFDHLGNIGEQAEAAAASGSTIIYATGFGGIGYEGLRSRLRHFDCEAVNF